MGVDVKPLTHWIIYKKYKVRFTQRTPTLVTGVLTTPTGEVPFRYLPPTRQLILAAARGSDSTTVTINEYGWEVEPD